MNRNRRTNLKLGIAAWITPIVNSVILPVHAQTSICSMLDLVGTWRFILSTHVVPALNPTFELRADGSTSDAASIWEVDGNQFTLRQDISDYIFVAELTSNCNYLSGTSTTSFTDPPFNLPENGVWSAERISS